jgi:hypothetical protein
MRQRKRAEWPLSVYQYWVRLQFPTWAHLPEGARQEADALRVLWNQLVDAFERRQAAYREIVSQFEHPDQLPETAKAERHALHHLQQSFFAELRRLTAGCPATWAGRELLLNQFLTAVGRFFKKQNGPPKQKLGPPREAHFHHRFTSGGIPVERVFGRSRRLHLEPVPAEAFNPALPQRQRKRLARTVGTFQAGSATLSFSTLLHRPLPAGAYLKTAALIGRQVVRNGYHRHHGGGHMIPARWRWSLQLTLELPPLTLPAESSEKPVAALHVQPHMGSDGQLRIGVLVDSTGREEALYLPEKILTVWRYKRALQSKADHCLEEAKELLRHVPQPTPLPPTAQSLFAHLRAARAPGLWHLLQLLEEIGATEEALEVLRRWADRSTKLLREARGLERRYFGHRDWFYRNVALELCRRYRHLAVTTTEDLPVTAGQEPEGGHTQPQGAATYRQLAAFSRFLVFLQETAAKTGTEVVKGHWPQYGVTLTNRSEVFADPVQRGES